MVSVTFLDIIQQQADSKVKQETEPVFTASVHESVTI